ncbi:hypothetical protein FAES_3994 [Fibrella aestuarina BUZ 2]|uniref:Uncharacterized protein n=2 Tax=Fibrella TaxID=861914 RepID=I0KCZ2_9BACT|nr:hypothetical protein FAES_3994 [Fibrella aestuarina BUZ 2]
MYLLAFGMNGCGYRPYIKTIIDPFTGVATRTMTIGYKQTELIADAIAYSNDPVSYRLAQLNRLPAYDVILSASEGDTLLTFIRWSPQIKYDVPDTASLLILPGLSLYREANETPLALPLKKRFHTIGGPLVVQAHVDQAAMRLMGASGVKAFRVTQVTANESDPEPVSYYWLTDKAKAFRKGIALFDAPPKQRLEPQERVKKSKGIKTPKYF